MTGTTSNTITQRQALHIAIKMWNDQPVWETLKFEEELRRRCEAFYHVTLSDVEKIKTGRARWRNIADWVKANATKANQTTTIVINQREFRIWNNWRGELDGQEYTTVKHFQSVVRELAGLKTIITIPFKDLDVGKPFVLPERGQDGKWTKCSDIWAVNSDNPELSGEVSPDQDVLPLNAKRGK